MHKLGKLIASAVALLHWVATLMLLGIVLVNAVNVVGRYVFNRPLETADELMIFMLTAAVFFCLPRCTYEDTHIRMDMLRERASGRVRQVWDVLLELLQFAVLCTVIFLTVPSIVRLFEWEQVSEAAKIPMWLVHGVVPLGFGLAAITALVLIARVLRNGKPS